jgi:hypothetical protein
MRQVGGLCAEDQLSTSHLDGDPHRVQVLEVLHGQLRPPPRQIRNSVRELELPGHGERLPHAHHQPRRASPVADNRARPGPRRVATDAPAPAQADAVGTSAPRRRWRSGQRSRQARMEIRDKEATRFSYATAVEYNQDISNKFQNPKLSTQFGTTWSPRAPSPQPTPD